MDFKTRLNSCGRFHTDENFKKIIMRNSCRLRQNSAAPKKESYNNKESINELVNYTEKKNSNRKRSYFTRRKHFKNQRNQRNENNEKNEINESNERNEKIEREISPVKEDKKMIKQMSFLSKKSRFSRFNHSYFYQDIRALKLNKNNNVENENNKTTLDIIENKTNINNFTKEQKDDNINENRIKKNEDNSMGEIKKVNTINHSTKKRRRFFMKGIKNGLNNESNNNNIMNNEDDNDTKKKKDIDKCDEKQTEKTSLNGSFYIKKKSNTSVPDISPIENNNSINKKYVSKDSIELYKKPQKLHFRRRRYNHNSISIIPFSISKINPGFSKNDKKEEKKIEEKIEEKKVENINKSISHITYEPIIIDDSINNFFCELIDLSNGMEEKSLFDILVNNLNKKYIFNYKEDLFPMSNIRFSHCFKYFCALVTPLLFLSKDNDLYKYDSVKGRLIINQFIFSTLGYIGHNYFDIIKIQNFIKKYSGCKKAPIIYSTICLIKLIFGEKQEYEPLKNALIQLVKNSLNESVDNIIKILNDTILFCFNNKPKEKEKLYCPFYKKRNKIKLEENSKISDLSPTTPFIKSSMKKEFCLVLDIDETISHSMKLSCGYYFLLRPGTIDFLKELSNYYEIDIFTSSLKLYADFIIDKIDFDGDLISHRLYKNHVTYEEGKSIKNLNNIGRDINKIIFVDNLKSNAKYNLKNLCHISSWTNDIYDNELIKLKNKLKYIATSGKYNDDITKGIN